MHRRRRLAALVWTLAFAGVACSKAPPAPPPDDAAARDRAKLETMVLADAAFDQAMKAADDADRAGDDARAAALLGGEATRAADEAIARATGASLETPWAAARRDSLVAVLRARKDTLPKYASALTGEDLGAKLAAVQTQLELQRWAVDAAKAALAPAPDAG